MAMGTEEGMGPPIPDGPLVATYYPPIVPFNYYSHPTASFVPDGFPMPELTCAPAQPQPFVNLAHQLPDSLPAQLPQQAAMSPSVSSRGGTPSALGSPWSVPDCEEMDGYSYQGSPLGGVPYKQGSPVAWSSPAQDPSPSLWSPPAQGPASPSSWSSPLQVFRQVDEGFQQQGFQQSVCSPVSGPAQVQNGMYAQTNHPFAQDASPASPGIPMSAPTSNPVIAPATSAPAQAPVKLEDGASSASEAADGDDAESIRHQPYSKQLVQALLSHPRRAMTVQQIYRWFEENTDRHESSGWQNSIRHNLSLNKVRTHPLPRFPPCPPHTPDKNGKLTLLAQAFTMQPRRCSDGGSPKSSSKPAKRGNEWVLEPFAVKGVLSTAKYRPKGSRARTTPGRRSYISGPGRRSSGRRGGCATSLMKRRLSPSGSTAWTLSPVISQDAGLAPVFAAGGFDVSGYHISDVSGVYDQGRLFAEIGYRDIHGQLQ